MADFLNIGALVTLSRSILSGVVKAMLLVLTMCFVFFDDGIRLGTDLISNLTTNTVDNFYKKLFGVKNPPVMTCFLSMASSGRGCGTALRVFFAVGAVDVFLVRMFRNRMSKSVLPLIKTTLTKATIKATNKVFLFQQLAVTKVGGAMCVFVVYTKDCLLLS